MNKVRLDLVNEELHGKHSDGLKYHRLKLSRRFIDKLLNNYYCCEMTEHFYDSEPDVDSYISDMAFMYNFCSEKDINSDDEHFTKKYIKDTYGKEYTAEEAKRCAEENNRLYEEYIHSERRLTFNNWIEVYGKGVWDMSQHRVDEVAREKLQMLYEWSHKDRFWIARDKNYIMVYAYGRDTGCDYWFIMKKRNKRVK